MSDPKADFVLSLTAVAMERRPTDSLDDIFGFVVALSSRIWPEMIEGLQLRDMIRPVSDMPKSAPIEDAPDPIAALAPEPPAILPEGHTGELMPMPARIAAKPETRDPGRPGPGVEAGQQPAAVQQTEEQSEVDALQAGEVSASPATPLPPPVRHEAKPGWQRVGTGPTVLTAKPAAAPVQPHPRMVLPADGEGAAWTRERDEDLRRMRLDEELSWQVIAERTGRSPGALKVRASHLKAKDLWFRKVTEQVLSSGGGGSSLGHVI